MGQNMGYNVGTKGEIFKVLISWYKMWDTIRKRRY